MKHRPANRISAFTLIEVFAVIAVVVVLLFLLLPARHKATRAPRIRCISNLKQIGIAYRIWAGDHQDRFPMGLSIAEGGTKEFVATGVVSPHFQVMSNELNTPKILVCPTDKAKSPASWFDYAFAAANINYFVGLDAETNSPMMFLSGDDNLSIGNEPVKSGLLYLLATNAVSWTENRHNRQGNVGLADGGVQGFSSSALRQALQATGLATNRLAIP